MDKLKPQLSESDSKRYAQQGHNLSCSRRQTGRPLAANRRKLMTQNWNAEVPKNRWNRAKKPIMH